MWEGDDVFDGEALEVELEEEEEKLEEEEEEKLLLLSGSYLSTSCSPGFLSCCPSLNPEGSVVCYLCSVRLDRFFS